MLTTSTLVAAVRKVDAGPIASNADKYREDRLTSWDAVDVIRVSGYNPTSEWQAQLDRIEPVVRALGEPFLFIEADCPSRDGSPARPNVGTLVGAPSEAAAPPACPDEMMTAAADHDWVGGSCPWDWPAESYPPETAGTNDDYYMYDKERGKMVRSH